MDRLSQGLWFILQTNEIFIIMTQQAGQQERQPQVAHIDVEPTRVPPVTAAQKPPNAAGEDPALRELSVPLMAEDEFTPQNHTTKREKPK